MVAEDLSGSQTHEESTGLRAQVQQPGKQGGTDTGLSIPKNRRMFEAVGLGQVDEI